MVAIILHLYTAYFLSKNEIKLSNYLKTLKIRLLINVSLPSCFLFFSFRKGNLWALYIFHKYKGHIKKLSLFVGIHYTIHSAFA